MNGTLIRQLPLDLKFAPALGRDDFMVGACNMLAVRLVEGWPDAWSGLPAAVIFGPAGSGKSHLAAVWQKRSDAYILSGADFCHASADSIINSAQNFVLDGLDDLIGDPAQEEKLFHIYNAFRQGGLYFLVLSVVSPESMPFHLKDLESRLRGAGRAEISMPDDELLVQVMAKRFADQNLKIDQAGLDYLLARMDRSWGGLDSLVEKVRLAATAARRGDLTKPLLRTAMGESGGL